MINKEKLRIALVKHHMNYTSLAEKIGMSKAVMSTRIVGRTEFRLSEIQRITEVLDLTADEAQEIFFEE